jgi:hypothetical protein
MSVQLPTSIIREIAALADVDSSLTPDFERGIRKAVAIAWRCAGADFAELKRKLRATEAASRRLVAADKKLSKSAQEYLQAVTALCRRGVELGAIGMATVAAEFEGDIPQATPESISPERTRALEMDIDVLKSFASRDWTNTATGFTQGSRRRRPGRPKGPWYGRRNIRRFVRSMLSASADAGGRLTFSNRYPTSGTLWRALVLLAPFVPDGFVPRVPPAEKLADLCAEWRRDRRAVVKGKSARAA